MIKVGVDIGNSKISCVVCDIKKDNTKQILSFISYPTKNINKGFISNIKSIKNEISILIRSAEKESQTEIKSIYLNIPVIDSTSSYFNSKIKIDNEMITELHLKKAINQSDFFETSSNYKILMNYITNYEVDDKIFFSSPAGNFGEKINLNFYKLLVNKNIINTLKNLLNDLQIHIVHYIPTPLSSALAALSKDDKELGAICIDLGDSSTSIAVFENAKLIFTDAINIGSKNITNDIAKGISTTKESAERLKNLYGSVLSSPSDEYEKIEIPIVSNEPNQFKQINRSTVNSIIKPRVEETLEVVWQKLKQYNLQKKQIKNLVLTGGGSQLEGIDDYAKIIFDSNVRLSRPSTIPGLKKTFTGPQFSQTIGTVFFEKEDFEIDFLKNNNKIKKNQVLSRFSAWLDQYI